MLLPLTIVCKDISALAERALYETIILNNESSTERFIETTISAVNSRKSTLDYEGMYS